MKKIFTILTLSLTVALVGVLFAGCGEKSEMINVKEQYPKLVDALSRGNGGFKEDESSFESIKDGDKKILKVNLIYENEMLFVGVVDSIKNYMRYTFGKDYNEIDLSITQENPTNYYECKYIDGTWKEHDE